MNVGAASLFDLPAWAQNYNPRMPVPTAPALRSALNLRDYQFADVDGVEAAVETGHKGIVYRAATGLGKSVFIAELAKRRRQYGRVMVTVDVGSLAADLAQTISHHTGDSVGILTGPIKEGLHRRIVISTVQSLYATYDGDRRYEMTFDPSEFYTLLVDECESSIADEFSGVVRHFRQNPNLVLVGASATPFRSDGRGMAELYDYAADEPGVLNRDILWGRDEGWLVPVRQGFLRVSVDFSTLKLRRGADGEKDYSEADVADIINNESSLIELAQGIHRVSNGEPGIVICPNSTNIADSLAGHLEAIDRGCASSVHGKQGSRADDIIASFKRGDFPLLVSVNKLYKGFDADRVKHVFMARRTKSRRIYEQVMGRSTRPLVGIRNQLGDANDAAERRAIIEGSDKPYAVMWDLVGLNDSATDIVSVIDILGTPDTRVRERAKKNMAAEGEDGQDILEAERKAKRELADEHRRAKEEEEKEKRRRIQVKADVEWQISNGKPVKSGGLATFNEGRLAGRTLRWLRSQKVPEKIIAARSSEQNKKLASNLTARHKRGLCSYAQAALLKKYGYPKETLRAMSRNEASTAIDTIARNGWKKVA